MCSCPSHLFVLAKAVFWYLTPLVVRRYHVVGGAAGTVSSIGGWLQGGGLSGSTGMRIWGFGVDQAGGCGIEKAEFSPPPRPLSVGTRGFHGHHTVTWSLVVQPTFKCYTPQKVYEFWHVALCCWKWQMSCLLGWIGVFRRSRGLQLGDVRHA